MNINMSVERKLILAVTGASGAVYAQRLLRLLSASHLPFRERAVIFSENGLAVWRHELGTEPELPAVFRRFEPQDLIAGPASGSAGYTDMVICPCSMATLGRIAGGIADNLILRAADVMLKERRTLIVVPREMPYSLIHLKNMETITLAGGIVCPASPAFYARPQQAEEITATVSEKIAGLLGLEIDGFRWGGGL